MPVKRKPVLLFVDDEPDELSAQKLDLEGKKMAKVIVRHPRDVEEGDLIKADLALIDYQLDAWPERDGIQQISLEPTDGLALASILRRRLIKKGKASPTAFALHTGHFGAVAAPLPNENRHHAMARLINLEWVFKKETKWDQIAELGTAVQLLPRSWVKDNYAEAMPQLTKMLGINSRHPLQDQLIEDIEKCLPPIHEISEWSHGLSVLRWLLHRILPYPTFLWDRYYLAARLRIQPDHLESVFGDGGSLRKKFSSCEYKGVLSKFSGVRWWKSLIEEFLWKETGGKSADPDEVFALTTKFSKDLVSRSSPKDYPIVCLDEKYHPVSQFHSSKEAVRIKPDDWPAYASQAWTSISLANDSPKLKALVIQEDKEKLP